MVPEYSACFQLGLKSSVISVVFDLGGENLNYSSRTHTPLLQTGIKFGVDFEFGKWVPLVNTRIGYLTAVGEDNYWDSLDKSIRGPFGEMLLGIGRYFNEFMPYIGISFGAKRTIYRYYANEYSPFVGIKIGVRI